MKYCLLLFSSLAAAQTLSVSSSTASPGGTTKVDIMFAGSARSTVRPSTLEWTITYPARELVMDQKGPVTGAAARAAGKFVACRGRWKKAPVTYAYHCILAGGVGPVPDGVLATATFRLDPAAKSKAYPIDLEQVTAVAPDAKKIRIQKAGGAVTTQ
jgi:hypothetical protein